MFKLQNWLSGVALCGMLAGASGVVAHPSPGTVWPRRVGRPAPSVAPFETFRVSHFRVCG